MTPLMSPPPALNGSGPRSPWLGEPIPRSVYDRLKPALDFLIGSLMFVAALPIMLLAAVLVKLTSSGPVLYSQVRVGRDGRLYQIFKLRTMYHNCEAASGVRWCTKSDDRVTFVGRILRTSHIDELPQLWNILLGHMSLVGPRPERPEFVVPFCQLIDGYGGRLAVKPGLTGLAQIQRPPDLNMESVRNKLALDLEYVRRRCLWLDLRVMLGTVLYLAGCSFAAIGRLLRLPTTARVPAFKSPQQSLSAPIQALTTVPFSVAAGSLCSERLFSTPNGVLLDGSVTG
jgi:lipopolysaccharide/colanic/teichoic acid biosynthesis glycosyltransferase